MTHSRFSDYTTSGAFTLGLTRNQVSALTMMLGSGSPAYPGAMSGLERKGLVEAVPAPTPDNQDAIELRLTAPGLLVAALCREAGLTQFDGDPLIVELEALRAEIVRRRDEAVDARLTARGAIARVAELELQLAQERARHTGDRIPIRITPRDPRPHLSNEELRERAQDPA